MQGFTKGLIGAGVLASLSIFATSTWAGVLYDALPGSGTLVSNGFTLVAKTNQDIIDGKSKDYSVSASDAGTNGVWGINDNNSPVNAYMQAVRDPSLDGYGMSSSVGLVMGRIKAFSGTNTSGTIGYTVGFGANSFSGAMGIRSGVVKFADVPGSSTLNPTNYSTDTTTDYRVYAIRYNSGGGSFDAWISNGNNWSSNPLDWTQMVSGATVPGMTALIDNNAAKQTGIVIGSMGSSGNSSNTNVDWVFFNKNDVDNDTFVTPWDINPVPEPATLALLVLGGIPMMIRRRNAA